MIKTASQIADEVLLKVGMNNWPLVAQLRKKRRLERMQTASQPLKKMPKKKEKK